MNLTLPTVFGLSLIALASLAGCATGVDGDGDDGTSGNDEPVVAKVDDDGAKLTPTQLSSSGGATTCTTTTTCDRNYCCTTETCQFSTFITCVPNRKSTLVLGR